MPQLSESNKIDFKIISLVPDKFQTKLDIKNKALQQILIFWFYGTISTQKTSIEASKKVQNVFLQQSNIFQSGYKDSELMSALSYFMHVVGILLCSLYRRSPVGQNIDFNI